MATTNIRIYEGHLKVRWLLALASRREAPWPEAGRAPIPRPAHFPAFVTIKEFAAALGVTPGTFGTWFPPPDEARKPGAQNPGGNPPIPVVRDIARLFGFAPTGGTDDDATWREWWMTQWPSFTPQETRKRAYAPAHVFMARYLEALEIGNLNFQKATWKPQRPNSQALNELARLIAQFQAELAGQPIFKNVRPFIDSQIAEIPPSQSVPMELYLRHLRILQRALHENLFQLEGGEDSFHFGMYRLEHALSALLGEMPQSGTHKVVLTDDILFYYYAIRSAIHKSKDLLLPAAARYALDNLARYLDLVDHRPDRRIDLDELSALAGDIHRHPIGALWKIEQLIAQLIGKRAVNQPSWTRLLRSVEQAPLGAHFVRRDDKLVIDPSGDHTDVAAASDPIIHQIHDGVKRRAHEFIPAANRLTNQLGWTKFGIAASRFSDVVNRNTDEIPALIGTLYDTIIAMGSYLEFDTQIRQSLTPREIDPLPDDVRRELSELMRVAAPWVRRFPTARMLDDEAGAFLTRTDLYGPATDVVNAAARTHIISADDAELLYAVLDAANRGEFQGQKAGARGIWSSRNLVTVLSVVLSFEIGLVGNKAAEQSVIAQRGAQFYIQAENEVMKLFESAPDDIRHALLAMIDELKKKSGGGPAKLPEPPREQPVGEHDRDKERKPGR